MNSMAFARVDKDKKGKVSKNALVKTWKNEYELLTPAMRCFNILKKTNCDSIETDDFKPVMNSN